MTLKAEREVIERTLRENVADISKRHTTSGPPLTCVCCSQLASSCKL